MTESRMIDALMSQANRDRARILGLESRLSRIATLAADELARIEKHGGCCGFARRIQATVKEDRHD